MFITFKGDRSVSVADHDEIVPGDTVEVSDEVGSSLLLAGHGEDYTPENPLWVPGTAAEATATTARKVKEGLSVDVGDTQAPSVAPTPPETVSDEGKLTKKEAAKAAADDKDNA